jgi:hypothetical protein
MFFEDVKVQRGETVSGLGMAYGYKAGDWHKIWDDKKNADLVKRRGVPEHLQIADILFIPIPWKTVTRTLTTDARGASFLVQRDGEAGKRMSWVQTVYQSNQPAAGTTTFCVDGCPADDVLPFYWTNSEISSPPQWIKDFSGDPKVQLSKTFGDRPSRGKNPAAGKGTTQWRAIVSIAVVTGKRVTVYDSWVWGFDLTEAGKSTKVGPRSADASEVAGHLNLLKNGVGTAADNFGKQGWTFRKPPA